MADARTNIFGIGEVYELQREGQWVEKNRESYREYGYFAGGNDGDVGNAFTGVNRIDFSNDTATSNARGVLLNNWGRYVSAVNSRNFGYIQVENALQTQKFDFANDTAQVTNLGTLITGENLGYTGNFSNANFGYFCASIRSPSGTSLVNRINFSNDTALLTYRGNQTQSRDLCGGVGNSNYGYVTGSRENPRTSVDRIDYSNDSVRCLIRGPMSFGSEHRGNKLVNNNFGYYAGGGISSTTLSVVQRLSYANDLVNASVRGNISTANSGSIGGDTGNTNFGYIGNLSITLILNRIDYSNDTVLTSPRGSISPRRAGHGAMSSASFGGAPVSYLGAPWVATSPYGYFGGGIPGTPISTVDRIDYTNDTNTASVRGPLSVAKRGTAATGNSDFGYFGGGNNPSATYSTIDRVDYSNDLSVASSRGLLTVARFALSATGNFNFGYFAGGTSSGSVVDRIQYSNDTATASARGSLSRSRYASGATGNFNFGYFGAGYDGTSQTSIVDRIDYSNDSANVSVRTPLNVSAEGISATGNNNFGYFIAGRIIANLSTINRLDYSNDTQQPLLRGLLSNNKSYGSATGNSNFGYFGGGSPTTSTIDRINYSNDTQTASIRGPLSLAKSELSASSSQAFGGAPNTTKDPLPSYIRSSTKYIDSNTLDLPFKRVLRSFGYFGGGSSQGISDTSLIDRVDYSNDIQTAQFRTNLSLQRRVLTATGNSNFGYFCGGENPASRSEIDRIDYSNDVAQLSLRARISTSRGRVASGGNNNFGYIGSGFVSFVDRYDYSNDIINAISRLNLITVKNASAFCGNNNFGYIGAGALANDGSTILSRVDRINYSNDTATASVRGSLSVERWFFSATGNSNFGYFGGGGPITSRVDRINYSNDTETASVRGSLSLARSGLAATGNSNFGYFGGGYTPSPTTNYTLVNRIDYSNDTTTASVRGPLSLSKSVHTATTNARNS